MEFVVKITQYIQQLTKKEFERYLIISLVSVSLFMGGIVYFIYTKSSDMIKQIKKLETLATKSVKIMNDYEQLQQDEERFLGILGKQKDFNIKIYFEQFCKEQ